MVHDHGSTIRYCEKSKIKATANTDGSVNKLVTIFAGDVNASPSKIES